MQSIFEAVTQGDARRLNVDLARSQDARAARADERQERLSELSFRKQYIDETQATAKQRREREALVTQTIGGVVNMLAQAPADQRPQMLASALQVPQFAQMLSDDDIQGLNETVVPNLQNDDALAAMSTALGYPIEKPTFNNPMAALNAQGEEVLVRAGSDGSIAPVEGYRPRPRDGQVVSVGPDGSVTIGPGSAVGELQKGTTKDLESDAMADLDIAGRLDQISSLYRPEFLQFGERWDMLSTAARDRLGMELEPEESVRFGEFNRFKAEAGELMASVVNDLAGAAVSESEARRILRFLPDSGDGLFDGDSPQQFRDKTQRYRRSVDRAIARRNWLLKNGLPTDADSFTRYSLESMDAIMNRRHGEILAELTTQNPEKPAAEIQRMADDVARQEFGL